MWALITFSLILFIFIGMYVNRCLFRVDYSQVCMQTQWERSMGWVSLIPKAPYALYKSTTKTIKQWLR